MTTQIHNASHNSLRDDAVHTVIERLHKAADGQRLKFLTLLPRVVGSILSGKGATGGMTSGAMKDFLIPVSREQGQLLYLTARAIGAKNIVEFGTSFGVSTLYLASAVRDNGGGIVIGSEFEPTKHVRAVRHLEEAGLAEFAEVRLGDARETLKDVPDPVDMVLIDGEKTLYLEILQLLQPRLRPGAVVFGDNIFTFRSALRPYVEYVQSGENGFESTTLHLADGFEFSVYHG
jgi:predicted O-methyltransferase YrrM